MATTQEHLADSASLEAEPAPLYDNFYSPENRMFYSQSLYKPLDASQRQIRLLRVLPQGADGLMSFSLIDNVPLSSVCSKYTALSYCAGDPRKTETLYVNEMMFNAFANLGHALREVKLFWEKNGSSVAEELLWVDQICIDQSKPDERSHQVGMMKDIYAGAERVLISLATIDTDPSGADGVKWIKQVRGDLQEMGCKGMEEADDADCHILLLNYWEKKFLQSSFAEGFVGFYHLLGSPWWTRAWIWQEFVVAREADFLFEGASINWKVFAAVLSHFQEVHGGTSRPFDACLRAKTLAEKEANTHEPSSEADAMPFTFHLSGKNRRQVAVLLFRWKYEWRGPGDLKAWLECGRHCETSDPRDRVYAFLGLAHGCYGITPNYLVSKPMHDLLFDLLLDIAHKILFAEKTLNVLSFAGQAWRGDEKLVPSWVPDWTDPYYNFLQEVERPFSFQPGALHPVGSRENSLIIPNGTTLKVEGFRIDTLVAEQRERDLFWEKLGSVYTARGLFVEGVVGQREHYGPARRFQCQRNDTLWWFPGTELIIALRPENDYWVLLFTSRLRLPGKYTFSQSEGAHFEWVTNITRMILTHDVAGLLATGFKREVVDIH